MRAAASSPVRRVGGVLLVFLLVWFSALTVLAQQAEEPEGGSISPGGAPQVSAQSHTGAAAVSVPVLVPPGRAGLAPSLALSYSSFGRNGWLGVGFSLELASIQRSIKKGLDFAAEDFTVSAGGSAAELVRRPEWGPGFFGAKVESGFTKYRFLGEAGFEALSKDGQRLYFGSRPESRQHDPAAPQRVFKWCLDRIEDPNGNFLTVEYAKEAGEIYPRQIRYTGHPRLAAANEVIFHLEGRPDVLRRYTAGFEVVTARRLKTIEVRAGGELVRAYGLVYEEAGGRSFVREFVLCGADAAVGAGGETAGGSRRRVFAAEFSPPADRLAHRLAGLDAGLLNDGVLYPADFDGDGRGDLFFHRCETGVNRLFLSRPDGGFTRLEKPVDPGLVDSGKEDVGTVYMADFDGDGRADVFFHRPVSGVNRLFLSNGQGGFIRVEEPIKSGLVDGGGGNKGGQFTPGDFDGDGLIDLLYRRPDSGYYLLFLNQGGGRFAAGIRPFGVASLEEGALFAADFNGDGRCDVLIHRRETGRNRLYLSRAGLDYARLESALPQELVDRDGRLQMGDFNGDGLNDVLYLNAGLVRVFLNQGGGRFVLLENAALGLPPAAELRGRLVCGDFSGNGQTDLFFFNQDTGRNRLCIARGDGGFADMGPMLPESAVKAYANTYPTVVDANGDGRGEVLFHRKSNGVVSFAEGPEGLPGLMVRVENALGGDSRFDYAPSSRFANTNLPFVVPVLLSVTTRDGLNETPAGSMRFAYAGGLYDRAEREFRGFAKIDATAADGTMAESYVHQDKFLQGKSRRVDSRAAAGGPLLSRVDFSWQAAPVAETGAAFVKLTGKKTEVYDAETIATLEEFVYDELNGNLLESRSSGPGAEGIVRRTEHRNFGEWLFRPVRETLEGEVSGKVRESRLEYERRTGNLIAREEWLAGGANPRFQMSCDEFGNPVSTTDPLGHLTRTVYDEETRTFPVRVELPRTGKVEHVRKAVFDLRFGNPVAGTDENGNTTSYRYDAFGRLVQTLSPDGGERLLEYHDEELPARVVTLVREDADGGMIRSLQYFDGLGRGVQGVAFGENGKPVVTRSFYDEMGRNHATYGPFFADGIEFPQPVPSVCPRSQKRFDARGRVVAVARPDSVNGTVEALFSHSGLSVTATDPDGGSRTERKDYLGRVVAVVEHAEGGDALTTYAYNAAGDLVTVTNALGVAVSMSYDTLGRKCGMQDPDMGAWGYAYDAAGRLVSQTDAKGQRTDLAYDALGRVVKKSFSTGDPEARYFYDGAGVANGIGRLYQVKNENATTTYRAYDAAGRVLEVEKSIRGAPRQAYTSRFSYDAAGRPESLVYPDSYKVLYAYHRGTALLKSVTGITDFTEYAAFESYDALGRAGYVYNGNGTATTRSFDAASGRLLALATEDPNLALLQKSAYRYSPAGDTLEITEEKPGETATRRYTYDRRHRLTGEQSSGGPVDYASARIAPAFDESFPLHAPKTLVVGAVSYPFIYDANGNMVRMPDTTDPMNVRERKIVYNAENMPVRISYLGEEDLPDGGGGGGNGGASGGGGGGGGCFIVAAHAAGKPAPPAVELFYDGEGRRVLKVAGGKRRVFTVFAHFEVADGTETKYVFAGRLRIARVSAGAAQFFHKDELGSSRLLSDDERGAVVETADYLPFGLARSQGGKAVARHRYTDQEFDAETGLYNYNARLYDPALGVFITPDSLVQDPFDPQTLNRYAYARNNPLKYVDPSGHDFGLTAIIIGAVIGAAISGYQSDWNPKAMVIGGAIGAVSGAVGGWGSGLVGNGIAGATFGGALAGATAGGLNAAVYGGNLSESIMYGAMWGAVGGAIFGSIGSNFNNDWPLERILANGLAGGVLSKAQGGDFASGLVLSAGSALAMRGWLEMRDQVDASSLASRNPENPKIRYHPMDGEFDTIGERRCTGDCRGSLNTNIFEGDFPNFESEHGRFVNLVSKTHDFANSWNYTDRGYVIGRGPVFNFMYSLYSYAGMVPAGLYTAFAFSADCYLPFNRR